MNIKSKNRLLLLMTVFSFTVAFILLTVNCFATDYTPFGIMIAAILILLGTFTKIAHKNHSKTAGDSQDHADPHKR